MNSYILFSPVGPKFLENLKRVIARIRTDWWEDTKLPTHLTIGLGKASNAETKEAREQRIESMRKEVREMLSKIENRIYLLPHDLTITEHGHIILKFKPVLLEDAKDETRLQDLHDGFVKLGKRNHLYFNSDHIFKNFTPHVSIGRVKNMGKDAKLTPEQSKKIIQMLLPDHKKASMLKELIQIPFLNLYQFSFCHGTGDPRLAEADPNGPRNREVVTRTLAPRDLGVTRVKPHEKDGFMIHFDRKEEAQNAATFFYGFGITSSIDQGASKTLRALAEGYGLLLNRQEFLVIAGMIKNCYPSIARNELDANGIADAVPAQNAKVEIKIHQEEVERQKILAKAREEGQREARKEDALRIQQAMLLEKARQQEQARKDAEAKAKAEAIDAMIAEQDMLFAVLSKK